MFSIGIPTYNRADLLIPSLEKYSKDFKGTDIYVVDNGSQNFPFINTNISVLNQEKNIGVAASWNKLCKLIFSKHEWALILNDDIYCGYDNSVVESAIKKSKIGLVQSEKNWSVVLINKYLYEHIGDFDEQFYPAYFEDSDYIYRLKLDGLRHEADKTLNPKLFMSSGTYDKAPEMVNKAMADNKDRYIKKWGGLPFLETKF